MKENIQKEQTPTLSANRREFLGKIGKSALAVTAASVIVPFVDKNSTVSAQKLRDETGGFYQQRASSCFQYRMNTATANNSRLPNNGLVTGPFPKLVAPREAQIK